MVRVALAAMSRRTIMLVLAAVLIGGAAALALAWAHPGPSEAASLTRLAQPSAHASVDHVTRPTRQSPPLAAVVAVLVSVGMAVAVSVPRGRRGRRLRSVGLSLLLILVGVEGAVHSVHHLGDARAADRCLVATSAEHVSAVDIDVPTVACPQIPVSYTPLPLLPALARGASLAPDAGRAPPA
jgi:hypothetical protein